LYLSGIVFVLGVNFVVQGARMMGLWPDNNMAKESSDSENVATQNPTPDEEHQTDEKGYVSPN
jgi:hypothetical protein